MGYCDLLKMFRADLSSAVRFGPKFDDPPSIEGLGALSINVRYPRNIEIHPEAV